MSFLLHGSSAHTGMGWLDLVPRAGNLYIGGLYALYQTDLLNSSKITHVLSVIDYDPLLQERFPQLKHHHIRAEDDPNENLLQHFKATNEFIDGGLKGEDGKGGGGVFVHCAMGKSRSATLVVAYLMWKFDVTWEKGLEQLCEGRGVCDPNLGFKEQLQVYYRMLHAKGKQEAEVIYQKWLEERFTGEWWEWDARQKKMKSQL